MFGFFVGPCFVKLILNLQKQRPGQNTIKNLIFGNNGITNQAHIWKCIREFYETFL